MNIRTILVVGLALIFGGSAALGVNLMLDTPSEATVVVETKSILVAAVDIPRGTTLTGELVRTKKWPADLLPAGAIGEVEQVIDRAALASFVPGEPIVAAKIGEEGKGASSLVRAGMRAYTIQTPTVQSGVAGFVLPGNRVDVLLTVTRGSRDDETGGGVTTTLLQNVEVIAADQRLDQGAKQADGKQTLRSVTLQVKPDMVTKLTLAQQVGNLNLSLRNDTDNSIADTNRVTVRQLPHMAAALSGMQASDDPNDTNGDSMRLAFSNSQTGPARPLFIRTLRGSNAGMVHIPRN